MRSGSTTGDDSIPISDPLIITRIEVLEIFDRVLRRETELGDAYLFAVDVVDSAKDGTARLEDPAMFDPLEELASLSAVTYDIVEEIRGRLGLEHDTGSA